MIFYAIANLASEECYFDVDSMEMTSKLKSSCLFPTRGLADEFMLENSLVNYEVTDIKVLEYNENEFYWVRGLVSTWDA